MTIPPPPPPVTAMFPNPNRVQWAGMRTYTDPNELWARAAEYFHGCDVHNEKYLVTGLALWLGFCSRQEFYDYATKAGFEQVIKACRAQVEKSYEDQLRFSDKPTGAIFGLKNMGWKDEKHVDHSSTDGTMTPKTLVLLDTSQLSTEILAAVYQALIVKEPDGATVTR